MFAGAGGMSVGARWAGIHTEVAIDSDPHAIATYRGNGLSKRVLAKDVREISDFAELRPEGPLVLYGGPPCQGFSTSNQRTRSSANEGNWLFREYLRAVRQLEPEWVVFENVKGIVDTESGRFLSQVVDGLRALRYHISCGVLDASRYGVPQKRERLFIIGTTTRAVPSLPDPIDAVPVTVQDALEDLPPLENGASYHELPYVEGSKSKYAAFLRQERTTTFNHYVSRNAEYVVNRYKHIPPGGNWENIPVELMTNYADRNRCHTGIYRRLDRSKQAVVIGNYRKNMLIHPWQDRGLSVREAARLQSFPDEFIFSGSIGFQQQQVGNAVPPLLARAVFAHINRLDRTR